MASANVSARTSFFFDRSAIVAAVGKAAAAVLAKGGYRVMKAARGSMRKAKGPAKPGKPPHVHRGDLKRLLFFSYDPATRSVVVGPTPFNGPALVPRTLELGGQSAKHPNKRRRMRRIGGAGEIRIGGRPCVSTKSVKNWKNHTVQVTYVKLRSGAQAARANQLNAELYGPDMIGPVDIAARPYMGPALTKTLPELPPMWADAVR